MPDQAPKSPTSGPAEQKSPVRPCAPCGEPVPWIPESKLPPLPRNSVNSIVRKMLLANPMFPRFYADVTIATAPNSHEAKILAKNYQKIIDRINMLNLKSCTHIKVTGIPCGSPPLRGEQFCYFHQHAHRGVRKPPQSRLHPIAIFEDEESIQASLMEVVNALMRNTIDLKRAELILRALHIAVKNARRVKFAASAASMVKEVPEYPEPPAAEPEPAPAPVYRPPHTVAEIIEARAAIAAAYYGSNSETEIAHVGADAIVRPGGEAAVPNADPSKKKAPVSVKEAPKERKIAAHRASGG